MSHGQQTMLSPSHMPTELTYRSFRFQIDLSNEYWTRVFEPALDQWAGGLNPNPDVSCNK